MKSAPSTDRTALAALYRNAAKDVELTNRPSCCAITYLVSSSIAPLNCTEAMRYVSIFADGMIQYGYMVRDLAEEEQRGFRETALCFAAAMVEAGDA